MNNYAVANNNLSFYKQTGYAYRVLDKEWNQAAGILRKIVHGGYAKGKAMRLLLSVKAKSVMHVDDVFEVWTVG